MRLRPIAFFLALLLLAPAWSKQPPEFDPESLPEIAAQKFDGRDLQIVKTLAKNAVYTRYLISYRSGQLKISGIMNVPAGPGPFPVVITNHGYISPRIYTVGRGLKREQDYLARRGFVVIHPDYRNHGLSDKDPESENGLRLGYVEDVINAVLAVKQSDYQFLDKEKIGMMGHSLGGGICLNIMTTKPDLIKAFVLYAPVSADYIDNFNRWGRSNRETAESLLAKYGSPEPTAAFWHNMSAINYLDRVAVPVQLHHGTRDESCYIEWSDRLAAALKAKGKNVAYYRYPGERHEFGPQWTQFMARTAKYFHDLL
ncbi:MAG: alpha/beta fold hydrolase [Candidatus Margulisbacteria bacterium]|jgi:dipeptidyl aminopeptidase/acylaminoacyl peptidase|nr:alpha/beta fold hydrolase [Candidatus Margulisiibacteriota bacterium]